MAFQCGGAAGDAEGEDDAACPAGTRALREDALGLRVGQENALCVRVDLLSDARGTVRADGLFHHARKIAVAAGVEYICTSDLASEDLFCCRVEIAMLWRRLALPCPGGARDAAWVTLLACGKGASGGRAPDFGVLGWRRRAKFSRVQAGLLPGARGTADGVF